MSNPFRRQSASSGTSANTSNHLPSEIEAAALVGSPKKTRAFSPQSSPPEQFAGIKDNYVSRQDSTFRDSERDWDGYGPEETDRRSNFHIKIGENRASVAARAANLTGKPASLSLGLPVNPFNETSAPIDNPVSVPSGRPGQVVLDQTHRNRRISKALDVDSFKNLLLTGSTIAQKPVAESHPTSHGQGLPDGGSSTDTSSISRQSLFDNFHDTVLDNSADTPRSSYDLSSHENGWSNSDRKGSVQTAKMKPPPPRHRHGKTLTSKGPQTVSFDDFVPTISSSNQSVVRLVEPTSPFRSSACDPSSPSYKVQLQTPLATSNPPDQAAKPIPPALKIQETSSRPALMSPRKSAPPPPSARRPALSNRSRSNTTSSVVSQSDEQSTSYPLTTFDSLSSSRAPPPPPARRLRSSSNSAMICPQADFPDSHGILYAGSKAPLATLSGGTSLSRKLSTSASNTGLTSPPPPRPPPRRRSSRSSIDTTRTASSPVTTSPRASNELKRPSFDNERPISFGGIPPGRMIAEESDKDITQADQAKRSEASSSNILAEMDAFQREIDELRAKNQK